MKARFIPQSIQAAVILALSGCGGGGGGDPALGGANPSSANLVEITAANAKGVAGGAMQSALEGANFTTLAVPGTTQIDGTATKTTPLYSKVSAAQAEREAALVKQSPPVWSEAPVGPATAPCDLGGTATVSGDVATPESVSPGDRLTLTFDQCDDGTAVIDGRFSMTVVAFSGSVETGEFLLTMAVEIDALQIVDADGTAASDGDASLTIDASSSPILAITLSSDSLTIDGNGLSHSLSDYAMTQTIDTVTGDYTIDAAGGVSSSEFAGVAVFETVTPFAGFASAPPHLGELLISGANGATIRAVALDAQFVRLEVDTNGDGTADLVADYTWEELTNA